MSGNLAEKIKFGALSVDGKVLPFPKKPWGYEGTHAPFPGDIPRYDGGQIGIVHNGSPHKVISWIPAKCDGKDLLIADRNILSHISWDELNEQGLISGVEVKLYGKRYLLRVLTGGNRPLDGDYELGGFPHSNEWDSFITNRTATSSFPFPTNEDLGEYVSEESFNGTHNRYWNWAYTYSWCQESHHEVGSGRALRGFDSARYWYYSTSASRYTYIGFRPVLEALNSESLPSDDKKDFSKQLIKSPQIELFKLTPASDLKVLSEANEIIFVENALKSKAYRRLLEDITENALVGRYESRFELFVDEDPRLLDVFLTALEDAGYSATRGDGGPELFVNWNY
ncbi:hypothetical protein [Sporosarcina sp. FSL K6-5500]|uniref:hypothetical protein n=1 Tax=Sporosarcina sp. FSL K6-5500 TaxID=2921558 RepID=UPI0030FB0F3F